MRIKAGQTIETRDGLYTAQADEVWHSDARFRAAEQQASDAAAAVAQLRSDKATK